MLLCSTLLLVSPRAVAVPPSAPLFVWLKPPRALEAFVRLTLLLAGSGTVDVGPKPVLVSYPPLLHYACACVCGCAGLLLVD